MPTQPEPLLDVLIQRAIPERDPIQEDTQPFSRMPFVERIQRISQGGGMPARAFRPVRYEQIIFLR